MKSIIIDSIPQKVEIMLKNTANIPAEMKGIPQWVGWKGFPKADGKLTKKPYTLDGKYQASFKKHHSFTEVIASLEANHIDGIGFAMSKEAGYVCIDLDGDSLEDIPESLRSLTNHSYAERSPSGNGLHIWFKGEWPGKKSTQGKENRFTKDGFKVECFYETGYLTMTGDAINDLDIEENQMMIDYIYNMTEGKEEVLNAPSYSPQPLTNLEDEAVLKEVLKKKVNLELYRSGDTSKFGHDHSKADFALCLAIAKVSTDADQIERLFRNSALFRDEPEKHHSYPSRTVASAMLKAAAEKEKESALRIIEQENTTGKPSESALELTYFGGDKGTTFIPKWLGDDILREYPLFFNGTHIHVYKDGVYHRDQGGIIGRLVVDKLGDMYKKDRLSETVSYLQHKRWINSERVDASKELINVKNGLLEWKTGVLHPHTPDHLSTIQLPINYNPDAKSPNIEKFLHDIVSGDTIPTLYEWFGYSTIPSTRYEKAVILTGTGANGKSKFLELYQLFVGEANTSNISLQELENNRFKLAQLQGKLANVYADIPSQGMEKTNVFKTVTSGDRINAEFKGKNGFDFKPFARLTFSANELPKSADLTDGYFRRLIIVDFPNKFGEGGLKKDPHIMDKLSTAEELSGLLNLAIQGLNRLETQGFFTENQTTLEAIQQYKKEIDPLITFVDECCALNEDANVDKQMLYDEYVKWAYSAGVKALGKIKFYGRMEKSLKVQEYRSTPTAKRRFKGISLLI